MWKSIALKTAIIESEFSDNAEGEEIFKKHLTLEFRYDIISTLTIWQHIKYAGVAELHQISDLVVAEMLGVSADRQRPT